ncbi:MAG: sorbitol-6-phosphate dehydrogenase subunit [Planctomycetota bacterium]|jgi:sorbitol-6-phosphate 2-dehydrogenase
MSWLSLTGKTAIVTGGSLGIGRGVANGLAEVGANIVIADINAETGEAAAAEIAEQYGVGTLFVACNVADQEQVDAVIDGAVAKFGSVDVLINNAGILIPRLLVDPNGKEEITGDIIDKMLAVNIKGQFLVAQACARQMVKQQSGVLINMNSESGMEGSQGQSVYATTKAAGYNMVRSWSKELGKLGVRVVGVAPGIVEATALRNENYEKGLAYTRGKTVDELRKGYVDFSSIPIGRDCKIKEIADLCVFLASDRASYIHGTTINISGGKSRA